MFCQFFCGNIKIIFNSLLYFFIESIFLSATSSATLGAILGIMVSDTHHYENEVPFEVPGGWCWCKLDDLAFYKKGPFGSSLTKSMFVPDSSDAYKVYEQKNAINKDATLGHYFIDKSKFEELKGFAVQPEDIIVSCAGTIGETYVLPHDIREGIINQALMTIRLFDKSISDFYLLYFDFILKSEAAKESKGTAIKNIPPFDILKNFFIPLPPLEEQNRIIEKVSYWLSFVDTIDSEGSEMSNLISKTKSKILDLAIHGKLVPQDPNDEPALELLKRINPKFTPCDNAHCQYRFPIYWELVKLEDVCEFIRNGVSIRQIKGANGIPITRIETISNGIVDRDRMGYADIIDDTYEKYYLQHGDILMSHINSPIHVGKSALYESIEGEKIIHGMNLLCLRMKTGICPKYMNYLFMSEIFKDEIRPYIKNAVNQASINTRNLGGVYSPIPPYNEQQRIVTKIEELFAVLDEIQKSIEA